MQENKHTKIADYIWDMIMDKRPFGMDSILFWTKEIKSLTEFIPNDEIEYYYNPPEKVTYPEE